MGYRAGHRPCGRAARGSSRAAWTSGPSMPTPCSAGGPARSAGCASGRCLDRRSFPRPDGPRRLIVAAEAGEGSFTERSASAPKRFTPAILVGDVGSLPCAACIPPTFGELACSSPCSPSLRSSLRHAAVTKPSPATPVLRFRRLPTRRDRGRVSRLRILDRVPHRVGAGRGVRR